jgi:hypothetical protein
MTSLYEISAQYLEAMDWLTDPKNEVDAQTVSDTMEGLQGHVTDKIINVARYVANLESLSESIQAAEKRMKERRQAADSSANRLREYLLFMMQATGVDKAIAPDIQAGLAKLPASVRITDETQIPERFIRTKIIVEPNKTAIKEAGGCPGAEIVTGQYRVAIK